ncbi:MAG: Sensor protein resE [candidate division CPR2 bacterium GW2011_GWC2_39_10]|uniref:histidine kinase n=1 Tax=candidate division CPR2 bacterium GW2011_GWC2_39_10 TaxID=1618345 RepID=A0A0G0LSK8_UNCC2|nr:MAG: Sensor protein resE [candidate division CPR2 bacterium GW2011_GWC2_39_10]
MYLVNIINLVCFLSVLSLGVIAFLNQKERIVNRYFVIFTGFTSIWILSNFLFGVYPNLFFMRAEYAFGILPMPAAIIWISYLKNETIEKARLVFVSLPAFLFVFLTFLSGLVVRDINITDSLHFSVEMGNLYSIYSVIQAGYLGMLLYLLISGYVKSHGLKRVQMLYVLVGTSIFAIIGLIYGLILLPVFSLTSIGPLDAQSSIFFVSFSAYAMAKHRLMDIRFVASKAVQYLVLTAMILLVGFIAGFLILYASGRTIDLTVIIITAVVSALFFYVFEYIHKIIEEATNSFFLKNDYQTQRLIEEVGEDITSSMLLHEILFKVYAILEKSMKTSHILVATTREGQISETYAIGYGKLIKISLEEARDLWGQPMVDEYELEKGDYRLEILKKYDSGLSFCLKTHSYLGGIFLIGHKKTSEPYSIRDINVLKILAKQLSIAIQNAMQYEQTCHFAENLQEKVNQSTEKLVKANKHLRELDKAKDQFLSMASHQLRTPLTTIKGYLHMLVEGDFGELDTTQMAAMREAYVNSDRMERLIDDLLNISRIETNKFFMQGVHMDLAEIAAEEMAHLRERAESRGLYLKLSVIAGKRKNLVVDKLKLGQVISNLIENSIFYTREGGIEVIVDRDDDGVILKVKDTGIGIPEDQQRHLFSKFFRGTNAQRVRPDGSGLGLFLGKKIIEGHKGKIFFESEPGKGATFGFWLPWQTGMEESKNIKKIDSYLKAGK